MKANLQSECHTLAWLIVFWGCGLPSPANGQMEPGIAAQSTTARADQPRWETISNQWSKVSFAQLRQTAERGDFSAQYFLGRAYADGRGVTKDESTALSWIQRSAEGGLAEAQNRLGWMYDNGVGVHMDAVKAAAWYRKAVENGLVKAQVNLGMSYESGTGVKQDYAEAARLYRLAADRGQPMAQNNLGYLYFRGLGVPKSAKEAVEWYRKSAEQGEAFGQCNLGWMYENGFGVEKSREQAEFWTRKAADQGFAQAQFLMGCMAAHQRERLGASVIGNYQVALEWYQKAAAQKHVEAMLKLGDLYYYGKLGHDHREAAKWFRQAAEMGNDDAVIRLGNLYAANHSDLPADHSEAIRWFRIAAAKGDVESQFELGCLLVEGKNVTHDLVDAKNWLQSASQNGHLEASIKLAALNNAPLESVLAKLSRAELEAAVHRPAGDARLTLAISYEEGKGGPVNFAAAAEVYWRILNGGPERDRDEALRRVINLYAQKRLKFESSAGYAPKTPEMLARFLADWSDRVNWPNSLFQVGDMFQLGEMLPENNQQAVEWFARAAKSGSPQAMNRIGELWARGIDGPRDSVEAANWFRRAATNGLPEAQFNLGMLYTHDNGATNDSVEAWYWLHAAASQHFPAASTERDKLQALMTPAQLTEAQRRASDFPKQSTTKPSK